MSTQRTSREAGLPLPAIAALAGVAWWVIGYLPWVITGFDGSPDLYSLDADYHTALPLHGYGARLMFEYGLFGGICASAVGLVSGGRRTATYIATLIGMASAILVTLLQSYVAVQMAEAPLRGTDPLTLGVLAVACISGSLSGWALAWVATLGRAWLGIVISVLSGTAPWWIIDLGIQCANTLSRISGGTLDLRSLADEALPWSWLVLLAIALIIIGARPPSRLMLWPVAVLISWFAVAPGTALAVTTIATQYDDAPNNVVQTTWDIVMHLPDKEAVIKYAIAVGIAGIFTIGMRVWTDRHVSGRLAPTQSDESRFTTGSE